MAWTRKPGAPVSFSLAEAFAALITGDAIWDWLLDWIPALGYDLIDTDAFCADGPTGAEPLTFGDFQVSNRNPYATGANVGLLAVKIAGLAKDRVFGAYCENIPAATSGWCTLVDVSWPITGDQTWALSGIHPPPYAWTTVVPGEQLKISLSGPAITNLYWSHTSGTDIIVAGPNSNVVQTYTVPSGKTLLGAAFRHSGTNYTGRYWVQRVCMVPEVHTPTPQPAPVGYIPPTSRTYDDIADLGDELDNLEQKLDRVQQLLYYLISRNLIPADALGEPEVVDDDEVVDVKGAVGVLVTLSGIPASVSLGFGTPVRLFKVGRVSLGNNDGWFADYEIEHTPFVIAPLPPGTTQMTVNVIPPIVASIVKLLPQK